MSDTDKRGGGRKLIGGVLLIALVTTGAVAAYRSYEGRSARAPVSAPVPEAPAPAPATTTTPAASTTTPLAPAPPLTRAGILTAATAAASAYAAGATPAGDAASPLIGRPFRVVLPFGCFGPSGPDGPAAGQPAASWSYGADRSTVRVRVSPETWTESPFAPALGEDVERVEGFWIARPWLDSEACPAPRTDPLAAAPPSPSPQTVGLARVFEAGSSRLTQRGDRPYEVTLPAPQDGAPAAPQGYRLVLEGRVVGFRGREAFACRSAGPDQRPVCLLGVELDRVAIADPADTAVLGEWRN